jgi:hypothetical protein
MTELVDMLAARCVSDLDLLSFFMRPSLTRRAIESFTEESNADSESSSARGPKRAPAGTGSSAAGSKSSSSSSDKGASAISPEVELLMQDDRLKSIEPEMIESILTEILQAPDKVSWDDIGV